jgi:hypothetical protein
MGEDKAFKAYEVLKDCQSAKNRYKFALVCLKLKRYQEAELALTGANIPQNPREHHHLNLEENKFIPNGAAGYYILGLALEKQFKR